MEKTEKNTEKINNKPSSNEREVFETKENEFDWTALLFFGVIMILSLIVFNL